MNSRLPARFRCIALGMIILGHLVATPALSQTPRIDSLQRVLTRAKHDSVRVRAHAELCYFLAIRDNDRARAHGREAITLAKKLGSARAKAVAHTSVGYFQVQVWEIETGRKNLDIGLKQAVAGRDGAMAVRALRGLALAEQQGGKPDMALPYYQRALDATGQRGDSSMMGTVLGEIGQIHHGAGRYEPALEAYQRAQRLLDRHGPKAVVSDQLVMTGKLLHDMGRMEEAEAHYSRGLQLARSLRDTSQLAQHLHKIGVHFLRRSDHTQAMKYFRRSLELRERLPNKDRVSEVLGNMGVAFFHLGELDSALVYYQRTYAIHAQREARRHSAPSLGNIAHIYYLRGRIDTAIQLYERCRDIYEEAGDRNALLVTLGNLASMHSRQGRPADAIREYRRILGMMEESGYREGMPGILSNLALEHYRLGQYPESMDAARRCLSLAEELGDKDRQIDALHSLADIHNMQRRYDASISYQFRALKLSEEKKDGRRIAESRMGIGSVHQRNERYDEALEQYALALASFEELQIPVRIADVLRRMATVHNLNERLEEALHCYRRSLAVGPEARDYQPRTLQEMSVVYAKRGDLDSAITIATQALRLAREREDPSQEAAAARALSTHYQRKGNFAKAYEFLRTSGDLRDSLMRAANLRTINEMEAKYSAAEKQRTITSLEAEKQGQMLAIARTERQLAVQRLEADRNRQRAEILAQGQELQLRELDRRTTELELRTKELELHKKAKEKAARERNYQASIASRETSLRNLLLLGLLLTAALGFLSFKRIQSRRREALLQAEAAEYRVRATQAQALAMQVEIERRERQAQRRYAKQLIDTQERERKRIACALHDSLGQELLVIKNRTLHALQAAGLGERARTEFEQIEHMATEALRSVRHLSHDVRPYQLDRVGLTKTLRSTLQQLGEQTGLAIGSAIDDIDGLLPKEDETNVYRIVQECLNNVIKHAGASRAVVRIARGDRRIALSVSDDGRGIDGAAPSSSSAGFGLQNMRERAVMLGGTLRLDTTPGVGTTVEIDIPIEGRPSAHS